MVNRTRGAASEGPIFFVGQHRLTVTFAIDNDEDSIVARVATGSILLSIFSCLE